METPGHCCQGGKVKFLSHTLKRRQKWSSRLLTLITVDPTSVALKAASLALGTNIYTLASLKPCQSVKICCCRQVFVMIYKTPECFYDPKCTFSKCKNPDVCFFLNANKTKLCAKPGFWLLSCCMRGRLGQQLNPASSQAHVQKTSFLTGQAEWEIRDAVCFCECHASCCQSPRRGSWNVTRLSVCDTLITAGSHCGLIMASIKLSMLCLIFYLGAEDIYWYLLFTCLASISFSAVGWKQWGSYPRTPVFLHSDMACYIVSPCFMQRCMKFQRTEHQQSIVFVLLKVRWRFQV